MDNSPEQPSPQESPKTPSNWAETELSRIKREMIRASENDPKLPSREEVLVREILKTSHFLISSHLTPADSKEAITRSRIKAPNLAKKEALGQNITPVLELNPLECMKELGNALRAEHNPLFIPLLLAVTPDTADLSLNPPEEADQKLYEKAQQVIAKGGKVIFPNPKRAGVPMEAIIQADATPRITYTGNARNTVKTNDNILFLKGASQTALAMLQPKKQ